MGSLKSASVHVFIAGMALGNFVVVRSVLIVLSGGGVHADVII